MIDLAGVGSRETEIAKEERRQKTRMDNLEVLFQKGSLLWAGGTPIS